MEIMFDYDVVVSYCVRCEKTFQGEKVLSRKYVD
jgi:hypothetical protein